MKSLRQLRKDSGLTQEDLSVMSGISQDHLSFIERGIYKPTEKTRNKIEQALNTKVDWLETGTIELHDCNWYQAERQLKRLVELTLNLDLNEKREFTKIVRKYFKLNRRIEKWEHYEKVQF
jgi:transcriptional regulator with XRE-family HTH domain